MAPGSPRNRLLTAAVLALAAGGMSPAFVASPVAREAPPVPTAPNVTRGSVEHSRSTSTESPASTSVRSLLTQAAILKKKAHRDRGRYGRARGAWVARKVGGRLAYFHAQ